MCLPVKTVSDGVKHQSLRSELEPIQSKKERKDSGQKMKEIVYRGVEKKRKILRKKKKATVRFNGSFGLFRSIELVILLESCKNNPLPYVSSSKSVQLTKKRGV